MKIIKSVLWMLPLLVICSCGSDNLSNSKAEKIISKCLKKNPANQEVLLSINQVSFRNNSKKLENYKNIEKKGLITMESVDVKSKIKKPNGNDPLAQWRYEAELRRVERRGNTFKIEITTKAKKFISVAPENGNSIRMKSHKYVVDKVLEVQEIPSMNAAKVKVQYKAEDVTPFSILSSKDPAEFLIEDLDMVKTSNGWKYCDEF